MLSKIGKASTMNELFNIPCFNGMPFLSAPVIDDWASLPKSKRKSKFEWKCIQRKEKELLWISYTTHLFSKKYLLVLQIWYMTVLHFLKLKEKWNFSHSAYKKKEKGTTLNELYNIPLFNGLSLSFAILTDDRAPLPKRKRRKKYN